MAKRNNTKRNNNNNKTNGANEEKNNTKSAHWRARAEESSKPQREREREALSRFLLTQQMEYEMPLEAALRIQFVMHFPLISFTFCFTSFNFAFCFAVSHHAAITTKL